MVHFISRLVLLVRSAHCREDLVWIVSSLSAGVTDFRAVGKAYHLSAPAMEVMDGAALLTTEEKPLAVQIVDRILADIARGEYAYVP